MLRTDLSPPGSNEETVNSPKPSPLSNTRTRSRHSSCDSAFDNITSPIDYTNNYYEVEKSAKKTNKIISSDEKLISVPTNTFKLTDSISLDQSSSDKNNFARSGSATSISIETTTVAIEKTKCSVCGDKADQERFSVLVCDSCGGFFKRAIKNNRTYTCISNRACVLTKKTRNHCQYCRLAKCYKVGMNKKIAELEIDKDKKEKLLKKNIKELEASGLPSIPQVEMVDLEMISNAELFVDPRINTFANISVDPIRQLCLAADKQLVSLAEWAKLLPHFTDFPVMDQVKLLQWNWPELLIGGFCYRSSAVSDGILLATGLHLSRDNLQKAGVGSIVNKLFSEVINKMQKLKIDVSEWGCLRAIMLFAPDTKELNTVDQVEETRERYIATLCHYVKKTYPNDPNRLASLLLRLPPLKAIALQALEHLFFFKLIGDVPIDTFLLEMLDVDNH